MELAVFTGLALLAMGSALLMIVQRNPIYSALFLILTFFTEAGLFILLNAPFIAAVQVLVNAGAVMVLFLFVIMLLDLRRERIIWVPRDRTQRILGIALALAFLVEMAFALNALVSTPPHPFPPPQGGRVREGVTIGNTQLVGKLLFTDFLFPFEVTSVILLIAIIGAMVLAKSRLD